MKRRDFIRMSMASSPLLLAGCSIWPHLCPSCHSESDPANSQTTKVPTITPAEEGNDNADLAETQDVAPAKTQQQLSDELLRDQRAKSSYYSQNFPDDIYFKDEKFETMRTLTLKLRQVQKNIGFGNFNLISMDDFFRLASSSVSIGAISANEKSFLEEIFYFDASKYGFTGKKVMHKFTDNISKNLAVKIPRSGHYLIKGESLEVYNRVRNDIGDSLILTSGVRANAKQFHLFFEKALSTQGNISKASRSLAPPGYSFHGRSDFDVGKVGYGLKNFSDDFATTDEYKRLLDLGYINIRYTQNNTLGVRFEPWHIKVEDV